MSWNYRVVHQHGEHLGQSWETYAIHEVYYNAEGEPYMVSARPDRTSAEALAELRQVWRMMGEAFAKPVLEYDEIGTQREEATP